MVTTRDLRRLVRCLRVSVPIGRVRVFRRQPPGGLLGQAILSQEGRATILLRPDLTIDHASDVLVHEWAHVLAWRRHGVEIADHGAEWGVAYADALRALEREWSRRGWRDG